jgi:hypothetical protein
MVGSADTSQASDRACMVNTQTEALCDERHSAIIVPRGRRPPCEQIELELAAEVMIAMAFVNRYLLHS